MKVRLLKKIRKKYSIVKIDHDSEYKPMAWEGASFHRSVMPFPYYEAKTSITDHECFRSRKDAYDFLIKAFRREYRSVKNKTIF